MKYGQPVVYFMDEHIQYLKTFWLIHIWKCAGASTMPWKNCLVVHGAIEKIKLKKKWTFTSTWTDSFCFRCLLFYFFATKAFKTGHMFTFNFFWSSVKIQKQEQESDTCGISPVNLPWFRYLLSLLSCERSMYHIFFFFLDLISLIPLCWSVYL